MLLGGSFSMKSEMLVVRRFDGLTKICCFSTPAFLLLYHESFLPRVCEGSNAVDEKYGGSH